MPDTWEPAVASSKTMGSRTTHAASSPVALPRSISVDEDYSVQITLAGSDIERAPLIFALSSQLSHGIVSLSGAVATYTSSPDYHGPNGFTYTASDGLTTLASDAVSVTVNLLDEFNQWLAARSVTGGPNDDADGDSITTEFKYFLGADPGIATISDILPTATLVTANLETNPGNRDYQLFTRLKVVIDLPPTETPPPDE